MHRPGTYDRLRRPKLVIVAVVGIAVVFAAFYQWAQGNGTQPGLRTMQAGGQPSLQGDSGSAKSGVIRSFLSDVHQVRFDIPSTWDVREYNRSMTGPDVAGAWRVAAIGSGGVSGQDEEERINIEVLYYDTDITLDRWYTVTRDKWLVNPDDTFSEQYVNRDTADAIVMLKRVNSVLSPGYVTTSAFLSRGGRIWHVRGSSRSSLETELASRVLSITRSISVSQIR